jgi:hypothetical protein
MKKIIYLFLIISLTSCSKQKLSKENLISVYRIAWSNGYSEGIKNNSYEWVEAQRKIDECLFYLNFHIIFESLPDNGSFKMNQHLIIDKQIYYELDSILILSCINDTVIVYNKKDFEKLKNIEL